MVKVLQALSVLAASVYATEELYKDSSQPVLARVDDLIGRMTVEEKIMQTYSVNYDHQLATRFNKTSFAAIKLNKGGFECGTNYSKCVEQRNAFQKLMIETSRLNIPVTLINEGLHGGAEGGTVFPMPSAQGCSWNVSLVERINEAIAAQARATGVEVVFGPVVNMWTDARFGRAQEGFSEEPTVSAHLGAATVRGLQGGEGQKPNDYLAQDKVVSLGKHFVAYGAASQNGGGADVSPRTMRDIYLKPWRAFAKAGGRAAMPSHNHVDQIPMHAHEEMLDGVLRQEYGFGDGVLLTDCNDINVVNDFRYSSDATEAAAMALKASVDLDNMCSGSSDDHHSYQRLPKAYEEGLISEADLDRVVRRVLTLKFATGIFDNPYSDPALAQKSRMDSPENRALALEAARQTAVLLKNKNDVLPMVLTGKKVALIGPTASSASGSQDSIDSMLGSYTLYGSDVEVATFDKALAAVGAKATWAKGCVGNGAPDAGLAEHLEEATQLAQASDVSFLVLGDVDGHTCSEWGDRDSLDLPGGQLALLEAVANVSKTTIVVLMHGRQATFGPENRALNNVDALFAAWRPGEEGGNALVSLIQGDVNPSGKLVQNWPRTVGHIGGGSAPWLQRVKGKWISNKKGIQDKDGRLYDNYVTSQFDSTPLFRFGEGLSYTTFEYQSLKVAEAAGATLGASYRHAANATVWTATVTLKNTGDRAGTEVVQVYIQDPVGQAVVPFWKRLVGFTRVALKPGETSSVEIPLLYDDVAMHWGPPSKMVFRLASGTYTVSAGGSSDKDTLIEEVKLAGQPKVMEVAI